MLVIDVLESGPYSPFPCGLRSLRFTLGTIRTVECAPPMHIFSGHKEAPQNWIRGAS